MFIVSGSTNTIQYYSRYNQIDKYEILDHNSRIVDSGLTTIVGYNGKINHSGLTYSFEPNTTFTYKSYYIYNNVPYLANHSYLQSYQDDTRIGTFTEPVKTNTFKVKK